MLRIQITFTREEAMALLEWATEELRDPREQVHYLVRQALRERNPLKDARTTPERFPDTPSESISF